MKPVFPPHFADIRGSHVLAAVSGGADSVALLLLLCDRRTELQLTVSAAHIEHGIRGESSLSDELYVTELCASLSVPLYTRHVDVPHHMRPGEGLESAARRLRHEALEQVRRECGAKLIALAHHNDDQVETVLMHLLRGCGLNGARGMRRLDGVLYRPLLGYTKADLVGHLRKRGVTWCEDSTNSVPDNPRNALRLRALPLLREIYPGTDAAISRFAETCAVDEDYLLTETDRYARSRGIHGAFGTGIRSPETIPEAILRRLIARMLGFLPEHDQLLRILRLCRETRGKLSLRKDITLEKTAHALYLLPCRPVDLPEQPLCLNGSTELAGVGTLSAAPAAPIPLRGDPNTQVLDADALHGSTVRFRRPGDRMRPLGSGERLLSDILTDKKLDRPLRDTLPLIVKGNKVLWAVGICIAEEARITETTRSAVCLTWAPCGSDITTMEE